MVPQRAIDAINLAVRTTDGSVARLIFHHERPTGRKFGRRALGLLALLRPAFSGGVEMRQELGGFQDRFLAMVDALPHGIRLCDPSGRIAHQNPVLSALLADSAIRQALTVALDDITHRMRTDPIHGGLDPSHALTTVISVPAGMLRVRGSRATLEPHMRGWILLATEPISRSLPSPATVAAAFRLTRQQSRVALMLGAGASNAEIASALGISPHTARHHTESVVLRLGINSRGLVRSRLESASNH